MKTAVLALLLVAMPASAGIDVIRACKAERQSMIESGTPEHIADKHYLECLNRG